MKTEVKNFVLGVFKGFDQLLPEESFLPHINEETVIRFPNEPEYKGRQGFLDWYRGAQAAFVAPTIHTVSNLEVEALDGLYKVTFDLYFKATLTSDGSTLESTPKEIWLVDFSNPKTPLIKEYNVLL
ncbi:hypothetical protein [Vibrio alfacsensis]|uniref:hypothetical protein n=1 Tax=Vibrio alfacsensis TaxID=1074311 RepID=UPI00406921B3